MADPTMDALLRAGAAFLARRPAQKPPPDLFATCFPEQLAFIRDPSLRKVAFCTRRAAKSYSVGLICVDSMLKFPAKHLIVGHTRESVRGAFWVDVLKDIALRYSLDLTFNETRLEVMHSGGGSIRLLGMDSNEGEQRKALGQKYRVVAIDEAQDFRTDITQLVLGTLQPALADWRGTLILAGTPGNLPSGLFYEASAGKTAGWTVHRWDAYKNTSVPTGLKKRLCDQWAEEINTLISNNPRVIEVPWFRQNYMGEWVIEEDKLVYRYSPERNSYASLPEHPHGKWHYVLGCDLGFNDATAFVVCAYHDHDRTLYLLDCYARGNMDITEVAAKVKEFSSRYDFSALVVDNANKQAVEEMRRRHEIGWTPADKVGKSDFIELMNGDLIQGNIKLSPACKALATEWQKLIWDDRDKGQKRKEHPACDNHLSDAALYAWRHAYAYFSTPRSPDLQPYTPEWFEQEADRMEAAEERYQKELEAERNGEDATWLS
jgi:hypothetical protein